MPFAAGTRLGPYEIQGVLGAGGMGEVYRALDPRLNRPVALKIVPEDYAFDARRRERFRREAHAIAALSHPHIVTVFAAEEIDGHLVLAMELVEGRTLGDLVPRGGMPLARLLKLAVQIADALAAAHDRGIIHRDLKPRNVMVTPEGRAKVLDFGLAKLREVSSETASLHVTAPIIELTGEGRIVGTAAYMSPEQAEGRPLDHRTDLFALGIVLYELASGERPFQGESIISVLSAIVRDTPRSLQEVNPRLPREFTRIVRRCLEKDPEERYQSAKDLRHDLDDLRAELGSADLPATQGQAVAARRRWPFLAAGAAVAGAGLLGLWLGSRTVPRAPGSSRPVHVQQLTFEPGVESSPSISPDGQWVVYSRRSGEHTDVFLQAVGGDRPINLTDGSNAGNGQPAFSPDGERIAFRSSRQGAGLFVMGRTGDFVRRVSDAGYSPAWSPDGAQIAYSTVLVTDFVYSYAGGSVVWVVNVANGDRRQLTTLDAVQPAWSPSGRWIAFWGVDHRTRQRDLWTVSATGGQPIRLTDDIAVDSTPAWAPNGDSLYFSSNRGGALNIWRLPIDDATGRARGAPEAMLVAAESAVRPTLSRDGRLLAYVTSSWVGNVYVAPFDPVRGALAAPQAWLFGGPHHWSNVRISPDGNRLAVVRWSDQQDLFLVQADGSGMRRLTDEATGARCHEWSPDGRQIAYLSAQRGDPGLFTVEPDTGSVRKRTDIQTTGLLGCPAWSRDGRHMAILQGPADEATFLFDPARGWAEQTIDRLPAHPDGLFVPRAWSPNGRVLAGTVRNALVLYAPDTRAFRTVPSIPPITSASILEWLPDGVRLIAQGTGPRLYLIDVARGQATDLLNAGTESIRGYSLSRDARHLYVSRGPEEADVWVAALR